VTSQPGPVKTCWLWRQITRPLATVLSRPTNQCPEHVENVMNCGNMTFDAISMPTAVVRNRLAGMAARTGIQLFAVNPAYSSIWGDQHWRRPYPNVTRHQAAATVIGRRAQGFTARRRKGVTPTRPEDRGVRATDQAGPNSHQANTSSRQRPGTRGTKSRAPNRARTRLPGRATVTPAKANNGQLQL